jgi:hypothetical protein
MFFNGLGGVDSEDVKNEKFAKGGGVGKKLPKTIKIDNFYEGYINDDFTEMDVYYESDGWDSYKRWREDLQYASENENDSLNGPIYKALEKIGYTLSNENHEFDEENEVITYKIVKLEKDKMATGGGVGDGDILNIDIPKDYGTEEYQKIEVFNKDLGTMSIDEAKEAVSKLGEGWMLPSRSQFKNFIYPNKSKLSNIKDDKLYWTGDSAQKAFSRITSSYYCFDLENGRNWEKRKTSKLSVIAVRLKKDKSNLLAKGGKVSKAKKTTKTNPKPKMVRQYFEDYPYTYKDGGKA